MARPLRVLVPGGWYHVLNRGNRRDRIFRSAEDCRRFLGRLAELPERFRVEIHAYVLMDNHYHLLLRPRDPSLSRAIQWLQLSYSVRFNWAHRISGRLFQGRFKAVLIQHQADVPEVARYLHLNPVRIAGLGLAKAEQRRAKVAAIAEPRSGLVGRRLDALDAYPWSSWRVYGGMERAPDWLQTDLLLRANGGRSRKEWAAAMRAYTEGPVRQGRLDNPWDRVVGGAVLGEVDYAKELLSHAKANPEEQTEARALARAGRVPWDTLVGWAEEERGMAWEDALNRHADWTRDAVLFVAVRHGGYRLSEVFGNIPGLKYQAAAQGVGRIGARRATDPACDRFIRRLAERLSKI